LKYCKGVYSSNGGGGEGSSLNATSQ